MSTTQLLIVVLLVAAVLGAGGAGAALRQRPDSKSPPAPSTARDKNIQVMLETFRAIEQRDPNHENVERLRQLVQPDVEFHWPPALPYGGTSRAERRAGRPNWGDTWTPLQPTLVRRRMDPRVIAASGDEVVVLYHQRGVSAEGERFDGEVLGLYQVRDGKLARGQMFYFDEAAAVSYLARAASHRVR
jgi:ketosteroid isomerase-like protein